MNRESKDLLLSLLDVKFLGQVGQPLDRSMARQCSSWKEACAVRKRNSTIELVNGALDWLRNDAYAAGFSKSGSWNQLVLSLKSECVGLYDMLDGVVSAFALPEKHRIIVATACKEDLLRLLIETELSGLTKKHTLRTLGEIYLKGHFLCGWDGEFPYERDRALPWGGDFPPDGQLVIY